VWFAHLSKSDACLWALSYQAHGNTNGSIALFKDEDPLNCETTNVPVKIIIADYLALSTKKDTVLILSACGIYYTIG